MNPYFQRKLLPREYSSSDEDKLLIENLLDITSTFPFLLNQEKYVCLKQGALSLEEISIKNKACAADERRKSFNFKSIVCLEYFPFGLRRIFFWGHKKISDKDKIILFF